MKYTPLLPDIVVASSLLRSLLGLPALQLQLLATGSKLRQLRNRGTQGDICPQPYCHVFQNVNRRESHMRPLGQRTSKNIRY